MGLPDVKRRHVLRAIGEFDGLGREAFLRKYGFGEAKSYYLIHRRRRYDSKAIIGVAHGYARPDVGAFRAGDFYGGKVQVASRLQSLGFKVEVGTRRPARRNPTWTDAELVLALELYVNHGLLDDKDEQVIRLSKELNRLGAGVERPDPERFRNPNGVALKLANFAAIDPSYKGAGMSRGGKRDQTIWDRYSEDADALAEAARQVREGLGLPPDSPDVGSTDVVVGEVPTGSPKPFKVRRRGGTTEADRREARLVKRYVGHLEEEDHTVKQHRYRLGRAYSFSCDLFDETDRVLYEAKGTVSREAVRMAIGQVLDYRHLERHPSDTHAALLLPWRPARGLIDLLSSLEISVAWATAQGFDFRGKAFSKVLRR